MSGLLSGNFTIKYTLIDVSADDDLSTAIECLGLILLGIQLPSGWTTATVTLQGSIDGGTNYFELNDEDDAAITFTSVVASHICYALPSTPMIGGLTHVKLALGTAQTADQTVGVIFAVPNP